MATARDIAIRTIIGEAAKEGREGWAAVAAVLRNRASDSRWPDDVAKVALQDKQFSAWNSGAGGNDLVNKYGPGDDLYERVGRIYDGVMRGEIKDPTGGATHYYSPAGMDKLVSDGDQSNTIPRWLKGESERRGGNNVTIGGHIFTGASDGKSQPVEGEMEITNIQRVNSDNAPDYSALTQAYNDGLLTPEQAASYERAMQAGIISAPEPETPQLFVPTSIANAYASGALTPDQRAMVESAIEGGAMTWHPTQNARWEGDFVPQNDPDPEAPFITGTGQVDGLLSEYTPNREYAGERSNTARLAEPILEVGAAAMRGAMGQGPSIAEGLLGNVTDDPQDPIQKYVANPVNKYITNPILDTGLAAVSALGGGLAGAAGLVGDTAEAVGVPRSRQLANDLAAMPEAFGGLLGPRAARVAPVPQRVVTPPSARPAPPAQAVAPPPAAPSVAPITTAEEMGLAVGRASSGNKPAQRQVAASLDVDRYAAGSAERLGIDLPPDVLSNNRLIRESAGLTRSIAGTPVSAGWHDTIIRAADNAADAIRALSGDADLSQVSRSVLGKLKSTQRTLKTQASTIYKKIDGSVPGRTHVSPDATVSRLNRLLDNLGGEAGLTSAEKRLLDMVSDADQPVTYARLMREKQQIQRALRRGDGPYGDSDSYALQQLEKGLIADQTGTVAAVGGKSMADNLLLANQMTAQRKALEKTIVSSFGTNTDGSIATALQSAVRGAARGDVSSLNNVIKVIPEELRGQAVASAIASLAQSRRASEPGFGFAEFTKVYRGIKGNREAYREVFRAVGKPGMKIMRDLDRVSRRITEARGNVLTTGKANQALLEGMSAEKFLTRVLSTSMGRLASRTAAVGAGSIVAGPLGGGAAASGAEVLMGALTTAKSARLQSAGEMFSSPEFLRLSEQIAKGSASRAARSQVTRSPTYRRWAKLNGIGDPKVWLDAEIAKAGAIMSQQEEQGNGN